MTDMICINNFSKTYNDFSAVRNLTFNVAAGEILGLVGPNGAGKTTLLRTLSGIVPPTQGSLSVAGHDIVQNPLQAKQALGYIPDEPHLFESLTVWEHLEFTAAAYRVSDFKTAAEALLKLFNLDEKRLHVVQSLSRGMRQKVAIACAYLHNPQVILFDEPLTGLDPAGIRSIKQSMQERASQGAAVIISSHLLGMIETLCSHLLVLHHGQCLYFGGMADALQTFNQVKKDSSLEDVFFSITHADNEG